MVACRARFAGNSGAIAKNCNAAAAAQEQPNVEIILTRVLSTREAGTATVYTGLTLAIGVVMWAFSGLKFQVDMG